MTSRADIAQVPFGDSQFKQVWAGTPNDAGGTILLWNQDLNNTVYVGFRNSIAIAGLNTIPIPPNGMVTLGTDRTIYAIAAQGTANLVSIPGGGSFFRGLTQANGQLVLPSITSPNFVTGVSGWTIRKDGSAEFNNLTVRGTFNGTNYRLNSSGAFFYSGVPAAGNLIESITPPGVTNDGLTNAVISGHTLYAINPGPGSVIAFNEGFVSPGGIPTPAFTVFTAATAAGPFVAGTVQILFRGSLLEIVGEAQFDNEIIVPQVQIIDNAVPIAAGGAELFSTLGQARAASTDGNNYDMSRLTLVTGSQSINSAANLPITGIGITNKVAAQKYMVDGIIIASQGGAAFANNIGFEGPAIVRMSIAFLVIEGTTIFASGVLSAMGDFSTGVIPALTTFEVWLRGVIEFSLGGSNFGMHASQGTAGHLWNITPDGMLNLLPIS